MSASPVTGLHHVTAIAADPAVNAAFHADALGLRLLKRTVNFDDPTAWHLYYGDRLGAAGTVMTFFAWPRIRPGRPGAGQVTRIDYAVPPGALPFWRDRLPGLGARPTADDTAFGAPRAVFADPDGLPFALVETDDPRTPWTAPDIPEAAAIRGFHGVELGLHEAATTARILTEVFGYAAEATEGPVHRFRRPGGTAAVIDLREDPQLPRGTEGAGAVHHVAFSVPDRDAQTLIRERLSALGLQVTPSIDRQYFRAIYTRTPGGVLFEVATEDPGFTVDETPEALGTALKLPPRHEPLRAEITAALPPLNR